MFTVEANDFRKAAIPALNSAPLQSDGQLGFAFIPAIVIGAVSLLGGGTLWVMHEKHTEPRWVARRGRRRSCRCSLITLSRTKRRVSSRPSPAFPVGSGV